MDVLAWKKKLTDFLMPIEEDEANLENQREDAQVISMPRPLERQAEEETQELKVANGGTVSVTRPTFRAVQTHENPHRPKLTVHSTPKLSVRVYVPTKFEEVRHIADDLKAKRAVIVNYEKIELTEQRRICDFINGACYVMDGAAKRISDYLVLYVPKGVETSVAMSAAVLK